ncbi:MAG: type II toxin-antitoxin system RelE/ParE family toxin [Methylorubrum rhodinum]|uniref:type II toxin-antitoxin system RelE/ParE family toxin n=1 Tax=Methylorubrum rhodinum TaxID=29428 RepID=UPI003BB09200
MPPVPAIPLAFYRSAAGHEPVREWLRELPAEDKRVVGFDIRRVQLGWPIGLPVCRPMSGGLFEVRSTLPSRREARLLFGFHEGRLIALHAFIKKAQRTPAADLDLARRRLKDIIG